MNRLGELAYIPQLDEVTLLHVPGATAEFAKERSIEMLNLVGIAMPERVYASYPHELSGGMLQRCMIAAAIISEPKLLICDEPTTALDVTIQAQILGLMEKLRRDHGTSILLITHNMGVVAQLCDYVYVMYAGQVVEQAETFELFRDPRHPYTLGLLKAISSLDGEEERLYNIRGSVPDLADLPKGCRFCPRCDCAREDCGTEPPALAEISPGHWVRCINDETT